MRNTLFHFCQLWAVKLGFSYGYLKFPNKALINRNSVWYLVQILSILTPNLVRINIFFYPLLYLCICRIYWYIISCNISKFDQSKTHIYPHVQLFLTNPCINLLLHVSNNKYKYFLQNKSYLEHRRLSTQRATFLFHQTIHTPRLLLTGYVGLIWRSTAEAEAKAKATVVWVSHWGYFEGTLQLLNAWYSCHSSCSVSSTVLQFVASAVLCHMRPTLLVGGVWMCNSKTSNTALYKRDHQLLHWNWKYTFWNTNNCY